MKKIIGIVFLAGAVIAAFGCWMSYNQMQASTSWEKAPGKISVSQMQVTTVGLKRKYKANVEFDFTAGDQQYHGSRIRFADTTGSAEASQQAELDRYPIGKAVDVYFNASDPRQCVLEPGGGARGFLLVLPPLILAGIGVFLLKASN